jgi:phosphatidate cytidylyltransferase
MHSQRFLTAAVLGPLVFIVLWWGGRRFFDPVLLVVSAICLYEYFVLCFPGQWIVHGLGTIFGLLPVSSALMWEDPEYIVLAIYVAFVGTILVFLVSYSRWPHVLRSWATFFMGITYIGICAAHLGLLRFLPMGREWVLFLLVTIFGGDAGAYYVGKGIGRHRLCPKISSGKTIEGAIGGLALNAIAALFIWSVALKNIDLRILVPLALVIGAIGQVGDLAESIVKRSAGVKDSGKILPGHGGMFDRIDALLLAAPFLYWFLSLGKINGVVIR